MDTLHQVEVLWPEINENQIIVISNSDVSIGDTERWAGGWHNTGLKVAF